MIVCSKSLKSNCTPSHTNRRSYRRKISCLIYDCLGKHLHLDLPRQLFRVSEEVKHLTLLWLGNCLASNAGRGKMWTSQMGPLLGATLASDGFMLNLGAVLLRFCKPLAADPAKMDKVDATYPAKVTAATEDRSETLALALPFLH